MIGHSEGAAVTLGRATVGQYPPNPQRIEAEVDTFSHQNQRICEVSEA